MNERSFIVKCDAVPGKLPFLPALASDACSQPRLAASCRELQAGSPVLPGKKPAPYSMLDVERWALDVCLVKPQQRGALIESQRFIRDFLPSRRYLIGVSGGRDSIALLHLLVDLGYNKLVVCHLNHQLRGRESRRDARFVEKIARDLQLDSEIGSTDVGALAKQSKLSIETAARFARFAFFVEAARRRRCSRIFLAHHADDLVETACEINSYIGERHLEFREDATNAVLHSSRNKIRHRILPDIENQFGRDVRKTIRRAAQIWSEEEAVLDSLVPTDLTAVATLSVTTLRKLPVALQRRTILRWLRSRKVADVGFDIVENVRGLIEPGTKLTKVNLPRDRHARRRAGTIFVQ